MSQLIFDAAFPPAGEFDWEGVLRAGGATGSMVYVFDPYINPDRWTPDYVRALQAAGFGILPVYVTFNQPVGHARQVMAEYGWSTGPLMGDIEAGSFPSQTTFQTWCEDLRDHGYTPVAYGTASTLDSYRRYADRAFLASYRALHTVQPVPSLDGVSYDGWQYSDQIFVNGVEIDASVTSIPLITTAGGWLMALNDAEQVELHTKTREVWNVIVFNGQSGNAANAASWLNDRVQELKDAPVGVDALVHALLYNGQNPDGSDTWVAQRVREIQAAQAKAAVATSSKVSVSGSLDLTPTGT